MPSESEFRRPTRCAIAAAALFATGAADASFLSGDALDTAADVLSWFVLIAMPPAAIGLFWMVHVLPQKAAEKRQHPQKEAIHVLCLLSLVFGGLLWPIAWLLAYSRPTGYALAHGTEQHEDYFEEQVALAESGGLADEAARSLRAELDRLEARGNLNSHLRAVRDRLARLASHAEA